MTKTVFAIAAIAAALFAGSANARGYRVDDVRPSDPNARLCDSRTGLTIPPGPRNVRGEPTSPGTPQEFVAYCRPHVEQTTPTGGDCPYNTPARQYTAAECAELARQHALDNRPVSPAPTPTPPLAADCWTYHPLSKERMVSLLQRGVADANWAGDMCLTPDKFSILFAQLEGAGPMGPGNLANYVQNLYVVSCTPDLVRDYAVVSPNGVKTEFGECRPGDMLWVHLDNSVQRPVWSETKFGGKAMARKGVHFPRP